LTTTMSTSAGIARSQPTNREFKKGWTNRLSLRRNSRRDGSGRPLWRTGRHPTTRWRLMMLSLSSRQAWLRPRAGLTDIPLVLANSRTIAYRRMPVKLTELKNLLRAETST
jgi:hypothetical protein